MTRLGVVVALWTVFTFVTWNVIYDRHVMASAVEFTRQQVLRHQNGGAPVSIHDGFSPRVRDAAMQATLRVTPLVAVGVVVIFLTCRRVR